MKRVLSFVLAALLCWQLLPVGIFAEESPETGLCDHHTAHDSACGGGEGAPCGYGCPICPVQNRIDALPGDITAENADAVAGELDAIHAEIMALMESTGAADPGALLNLDSYNAAAEALSALTGQNGGAVDEGGTRTDEPMPAAEVGDRFCDATSGLYFAVLTVLTTELTGTVEVTYPLTNEAAYNQPSYTIPETVSYGNRTFTVTEIDVKAFEKCSTLESVTIPDTVTTIGDLAFCGCENLSSINIPDSVTNIASYAFWKSSALKVMVWHDAPKTIGTDAFEGVSSVTHKLVTPTGLAYDSSAIAGNGVAFWKTNGTASGYNVYIYDSADETVAKWTTNVANDTSGNRNHLNMGDFLAEKGAPSGTYYFSVQAHGGFSGINGSDWSERLSFSYVKGAVPVVSNVTLTRRNEVSATLTFTVSEDCELYYSTAYAKEPANPDTTGTGIACTAGTNTVTITGLGDDNDGVDTSKWHVKFVLKDADGNLTDVQEKNVEKWTHQYSLTYETNGGTLLGPPEVYICDNSSIPITLPDATRSGYTLKGWTTAADGSGTIYPVNAGFTVTGNHVFYAQWELVAEPADTVTVTFQMNGHGTAPASQTITEGGKATEPADPTEEGYTFGGWYTEATCTNLWDFNTAVTRDITLYAKWTELVDISVTIRWLDTDNVDGKRPDGVTVKLLADGVDKESQEITSTENWTHTFSNLPSGPVYTISVDESNLEDYRTEVSGDVTAGFTVTCTYEDKTTYTVTFDMGGHGDAVNNQTITEGGTVTRPDEPAADGYHFDGWFLEETYITAYNFNTPVTQNITLYAKWTEIHVHTWATGWTSDATHHWYDCTAQNCDLTENTQKNGYGAHTDNGGGICSTCGCILDAAQLTTQIVTGDIAVAPGLEKTPFNTVPKIVEELTRVLTTGTGYASGNVATYDVKLQYSTDGGKTWITATEENFPKEGITVLLPYPDGTGRNTHDFRVTHMFTVDSERLGTTAGETEEPPVTKGEDGIQVTLKGLSPVGISWKSLETEEPQKPHKPWHRDWDKDWHKDREYDSDSPKTGDTTQNGLWLTLAAVGLLGLTVSLAAKKRLRKRK